ncbi:MAG: phosphate signaling complex protein PhoU [Magnetococcales bacterium]|nr:phosphate signaling complex protein PhoU [Magnetococcales bacterium]
MALYEQRLQTDLATIQEELSLIGERVEMALHNALYALFTHDETLANQTILGDMGINRLCLRLDRLCHSFIIRHQPSAGHLRSVLSALRMIDELERIGDYTTTISRAMLDMQHPPSGSLKQNLETMAQSAGTMLKQSLLAFASRDAQLARRTMPMADLVGQQLTAAFTDLEQAGNKHQYPVRFILNSSSLCTMLERVSDRAKNICEETLFMTAGEFKAEKYFSILFIDQDNSVKSQMAESIARRHYPTQALFSSAGQHAGTVDPNFLTFMRQQGCTFTEIRPKSLDALPLAPEDQIVVSLEGPVRSYPLPLSFHTTFLEWSVGEAPDEAENTSSKQEKYASLYREITAHLQTLMQTLRGEEIL